MNTLGPVKKVNLSEGIFNRILELIKEGYFKSGEKIVSERELCEMFDASRTSVREAIKGLTSVGVIVKRRDGNYVCENLADIIIKPIDILLNSYDLDMSEVLEARLAIESQLVRIAAVKATKEECDEMEACLVCDDDTPPEAIMRNAIAFHMLIAASTKNRILQEMYTVIYRIMHESRESGEGLRRVYQSRKQHMEILQNIRNRDADSAETAMRTHLSKLIVTKNE